MISNKLAMNRLALICIFLTKVSFVLAQDTPLKFDDLVKQEQYQGLIEELRCPKCQNQNLADSPAGIAMGLRKETYQMVKDGKTSEEVKDFMVQRYGEFVLYRPRLKISTLALWFAPFVLLLSGIALVLRIARSRSRGPNPELSDEEKVQLKALLGRDVDKI